MNFSVTARVRPPNHPNHQERRMLYADLHIELSASNSVSTQTLKNLKSVLSRWLEFHKLDLDCPVGPELSGLFDTAVEQFKSHLIDKGGRAETAADRVTLMRNWHRFFKNLGPTKQAKTGFAETLADAVEKSGITRKSIAISVGIWELTLREWLRGNRVPQNKHRLETVPNLEALLGLSPGMLTSQLPPPAPEAGLIQTAYQKLLKGNLRTPYALRDVPDSMKKEWLGYVRFKVLPIEKGLNRNTLWRIRPATSIGKNYGWESTIGQEVCPSANISWLCVANVIGFSVLEKNKGGLGLGQEAITLSTLADADIYNDLIVYMHSRSGKYNNGMVNLIAQIKAMVRPNTGYLWQKAKLFCKTYLHGEMTPDAYRQQCGDTYSHLLSIAKHLQSSSVLTMSRNPKEPIQNILDMQRPLEALFQLAEGVKRCAPSKSKPFDYAIHLRKLLLLQMLTAAPVRINQYAILTYFNNNSGHLYKADRSWWLRFNKHETKNHKDYNVRLYPGTYRLIEEYLDKYRPLLLAGHSSNYVFCSKPKVGGRTGNAPASVNYLSSIILNMTRNFIPDSPGFSPHAIRAIVATDFLKSHPGQFELAANLLDDEVATVIKHYAHLNKAAMHETFNKYSAEVEKTVLARLAASKPGLRACAT